MGPVLGFKPVTFPGMGGRFPLVEAEDPDCNRLPEEVNSIWTTRSGEDVAVGR